MPHRLGLNIGGTTCSAAVGDDLGVIHRRVDWASHAEAGPGAMIDRLMGEAEALLGEGGREAVASVGVAIGGPMNAETGTILSPPNLPGWDRVPLADRLGEALGRPVRVEHDAAACALAEHRWGAGQSVDRLAYLTCGTGFGVGLAIDGRAYYGADGAPPEIGYLRYRDDGPTAFGRAGCYEAMASASALSRLAAWAYPTRWGQAPPTPPRVAELAAEGDREARAVVELNAKAVGSAAALLVNLLGPRRVLLGSAARYLGEPWLAAVRAAADEEAGGWVAGRFQIMPAGLGDRLQDLSAIAAAAGAGPSDAG